jgi:hypothetical protein
MTMTNEIRELTDTDLDAAVGGKGAWQAAKDKVLEKQLHDAIMAPVYTPHPHTFP